MSEQPESRPRIARPGEARPAPPRGLDGRSVEEMGCPSYKERIEAANVAMEIEDARRLEAGKAAIVNRHAYRNRIADNFARPERWAECRRLLDQFEDEPVPEAPEEDEAPREELVPVIGPDGRKVFVTPEEYRSLRFDFTGEPQDEDRQVREPFEWLELKHPDDFALLLELEEGPYTRERLLEHAEKVARHRWRHLIARNKKTTRTTIFLLERLADFRKTVRRTHGAFAVRSRRPRL